MSRSLVDLRPPAMRAAAEWLRLCNAKGVAVLIVETLRTNERQNDLYAKGRTTPGPIVTWVRAGQSFHNYGVAWDAVPWELFLKDPNLLVEGRKLDWTPFKNSDHEQRFRLSSNLKHLDRRWRIMAEAAAECNIAWSGLWQLRTEYCHWQYDAGQTLDQLKAVA